MSSTNMAICDVIAPVQIINYKIQILSALLGSLEPRFAQTLTRQKAWGDTSICRSLANGLTPGPPSPLMLCIEKCHPLSLGNTFPASPVSYS